MNDEASYICDACGEEIVVPIDLSAGASQVTSRTARSAAARTSFTSRSKTATCGCGPNQSDAFSSLHRHAV